MTIWTPRHRVFSQPEVHSVLKVLKDVFIVDNRSLVFDGTVELLVGSPTVADWCVDLSELELLPVLLRLEVEYPKYRF